MVSDIACGSREPLANTLSPRRVTSRSSWRVRKRPRTDFAILRRTELEPISTAANVGMGQGAGCAAIFFAIATVSTIAASRADGNRRRGARRWRIAVCLRRALLQKQITCLEVGVRVGASNEFMAESDIPGAELKKIYSEVQEERKDFAVPASP